MQGSLQEKEKDIKAKEKVIKELNEEIKRLKEESDEYTVAKEAELAQLKIERDDLRMRYKYLKGVLIFMLVFGVIALVYYAKKKGLHLTIMDAIRECQQKMLTKSA